MDREIERSVGRAAGVRGLLIYYSDYRCSHHTAISGDDRSDDVRLSDLESRFTCQACGQRGADVRPNFDWEKEARAARPALLMADKGWLSLSQTLSCLAVDRESDDDRAQ